MSQHNETDYIIPVLLILYKHGEGCYMETIKNEISDFFVLSEEDKVPYASRNPNEPRYRQIVGNLISHNNPELFKFLKVEVVDNKSKYLLNEAGLSFVLALLQNNNNPVGDEKNQNADVNQVITQKEFVSPAVPNSNDQKIIRLAEKDGLKRRPPSDNNIHAAVVDMYGHKCQYALYMGEEHHTFLGADGKPYIIAHHLIPMSARKDFFPKNLDVATNLVCLCPNCHERIHHGQADEKRKILKTLYDHYIKQLNSDGLYISFDNLLKKYY